MSIIVFVVDQFSSDFNILNGSALSLKSQHILITPIHCSIVVSLQSICDLKAASVFTVMPSRLSSFHA